MTTADIPKSMVRIPAGPFTMGSTPDQADPYALLDLPPGARMTGNPYEEEMPRHEVWLDDFCMDVYPVTNAEYKAFCDATGHRPPCFWKGESPPADWEQRAVVGVSWYDAVLYADWAGKRLPTEAEWEKAARGTDGRLWPWGNTLELGNANFLHTNAPHASDSHLEAKDLLRPVGSYPQGVSPYGCFDMAGNVWEWCSDRYDKAYYSRGESRNPRGPSKGGHRILRGGACGDIPANARCATRFAQPPTKRTGAMGFRCAASMSPAQTREHAAAETREAKRYRPVSMGAAIALHVAWALAGGVAFLKWTDSWWFALFGLYFACVFAAGLGFILEKRNRLAARMTFELVNLVPPAVIAVAVQWIGGIPVVSVIAGFLGNLMISRRLLTGLFPDLYDEYDIRPPRKA